MFSDVVNYVTERYLYMKFGFVKFCLYYVWCWNSTRECRVSDSRGTRISNFLRPLPNKEILLRKIFRYFYKNQTVIYALNRCLLIGSCKAIPRNIYQFNVINTNNRKWCKVNNYRHPNDVIDFVLKSSL